MTRPPHRISPPMREGVSASCVALPANNGWSLLLDFLAQRLSGVPREDWMARMAQGRVFDEAGTSLPPDAPYRAQTRVYYYRELKNEPRIPFEESVLFQDDYLVVADKPHFLPVTPGGRFVQETLLVRLKRRLSIETLSPIHRIDRETAGLVLFSVRPRDRGAYQSLFRDKSVRKQYEAIAPRRNDLALPQVRMSRIEPDERFFRQREVPGEPNSETHIELLEVRGTLARYRLTPVSGKTHQLRVHMSALGVPIEGDLFYPEVVHGPGHAPEDHSRPLQLLARSLSFVDPISGEPRQFESQRRLSWT
jgi:tRNA pseudouridine32 synthase/23S rRNA pseudouridine746 synthase